MPLITLKKKVLKTPHYRVEFSLYVTRALRWVGEMPCPTVSTTCYPKVGESERKLSDFRTEHCSLITVRNSSYFFHEIENKYSEPAYQEKRK
jgi:hypothetical protein